MVASDSVRMSPLTLTRRIARVLSVLPAALRRHGFPYDAMTLERRDPELVEAVSKVFAWANRHYFRLRVEGLEHIQRTPTLYVANHNGGIVGPDLCCTLGTLWDTLGADAPLYAMAHDLAMKKLTPFGRLLQLGGGMRANPESAARAFAAGGQVLVYPGGELDAYRHYRRRDEVVFGARTGFVRVAQRAGVSIVPVVAHGAHRSAVIFHEGEWIARRLGLDRWSRIYRFPLALALPWGLAMGPWLPYLPLPFPIRLRFLAPIQVGEDEPVEQAQKRVVAAMQAAMHEMAGR